MIFTAERKTIAFQMREEEKEKKKVSQSKRNVREEVRKQELAAELKVAKALGNKSVKDRYNITVIK